MGKISRRERKKNKAISIIPSTKKKHYYIFSKLRTKR